MCLELDGGVEAGFWQIKISALNAQIAQGMHMKMLSLCVQN